MSGVSGIRRNNFLSIAVAAYIGMASAVPELGARRLRMPEPVPIPGDPLSPGPRRLRPARSILGLAMSRISRNTPHIGEREKLRRRIGGFYTLRRK